MRMLISIFVLSLLLGCVFPGQVRMMPRDSGTVFTGKIVGDGVNTATMDITIDGERYTGLWVVATTNDNVGLVQQYSSGGSSLGVVTASGGTRIMKGIFSSPNGLGLRCESTATGRGGAGICVDGKNRVFDITINAN